MSKWYNVDRLSINGTINLDYLPSYLKPIFMNFGVTFNQHQPNYNSIVIASNHTLPINESLLGLLP